MAGMPKTTWHGPFNAAGMPHVLGALDGVRIEGSTVDGLMQGQAVQTHPDGTRAEGAYVDGYHHGSLPGMWPDGTRFERQFANGTMAANRCLPPHTSSI